MKKDIRAVIHLPVGSSVALDDQMQTALAALGERERAILELRFGLTDGRGASLQEVGQTFGVTGERIRQIEARAIGKLRRWAHAQTPRLGSRPTAVEMAPPSPGECPAASAM